MSDFGKRGKPTFHPDTDPSPGVDDGCFEKGWLLVFIIYFASFLFWLVSSDGDPDAILPVAVGLFGFFLLFFIMFFSVRQKNKRLIEQHEQQQLSENADADLKAWEQQRQARAIRQERARQRKAAEENGA